MKNIYNYFLLVNNNLFKTLSTWYTKIWNYVTLNVKTSILILFIIIINKPLILLIINVIISFLIRCMLFNAIFAEEKTLYEEMNENETESGEPVLLSNIYKWFLEGLVWFLEWNPPRPYAPIILIPQESYPNQFSDDIFGTTPKFDNIDERFWSIPDSQPVEQQFETIVKDITPKIVIPVNSDEFKTFITEPLDIKSRSQMFLKDVVLNAKSREEQSKMNSVESYEYWVEVTKPEPRFSSNLLRELHFKLETCKNELDLFRVSIELVKESFPIDKRPIDLSEYENPISNFNLYLTDLQKQMLSYAEFISFFHFKAAALAYNKAYLFHEHDDLLQIKYYYDAEILNIRSYVSKSITSILKK